MSDAAPVKRLYYHSSGNSGKLFYRLDPRYCDNAESLQSGGKNIPFSEYKRFEETWGMHEEFVRQLMKESGIECTGDWPDEIMITFQARMSE